MNKIDFQPLMELGLTQLEALVYTYLLENSPSTGYGIAKGIGKPDANTYRAIESLHNKGAIIIDDSKTRLCRAISTDELLDSFQRRFDSVKSKAQSEFKKLKPSPGDNKIYQLQSTDQIISRYRKMLKKCKRIVILDFFPEMIDLLYDDIVSAAERGVGITLRAYQKCGIPGVNVKLAYKGDQIIAKWPGMWANGVFDGEEYLLAFLSKDGKQVLQSVWSNNHYLSWIYYQGIVHETLIADLRRAINDKQSNAALIRLLKKYDNLLKVKATGYKNAAAFMSGKKIKKSSKK